MPHVDPDGLALLALGERVEEIEDQHLAACAQCQSELDQLRAAVTTARSVGPEDSPVTPPAAVWDRVSAELGLTASPADVVPIRRAAPRSPVPFAVAAGFVGLLVGAGATALLTGALSADPDKGSEGSVLARTGLTRLADETAAGDAEILRSDDGRRLELDVPSLRTASAGGRAYYEVWLLRRDGTGLVSLGLLDPGNSTRGRFLLPPGLDVTDFAVVDVSREPADGDPSHSGDSILRGTLRT